MVVADDDPDVRQALAAILDEEVDFVLVAQVSDGQQALSSAAEHTAALVIVDVRMPHGGPQLVRALRALEHRPVVVGMSASADVATWTRMLAAGAGGYLLKGAVAADLPALLRRCCAGELIVTVAGAADVVQRLLGAGS